MSDHTEKLLRTGCALVTIRNPEGRHLVYRLRRRDGWVDATGHERPGIGYWIDCREADDWVPVGWSTEAGELKHTSISVESRAMRRGAFVMLQAVRGGARTAELGDRLYTVHVEHRCTRCGGELSDPIALDRGYGDTCWRKVQAELAPAEATAR